MEATVVVVEIAKLNVTVASTAELVKVNWQVRFVLPQPVTMAGLPVRLQPAMPDPAAGAAVSVTVSVSLNAALQVAPQLILPPVSDKLLVTVPLPVPFFTTFTFLLSVKVVAAVIPDGDPVAIRWNVMPKSCCSTWYTSCLLNTPFASDWTPTATSGCITGSS